MAMKYIIIPLLFAFALSFALQNCARAKYRHPADPHATDAQSSGNYANDYANNYANDYTHDSAMRAHEINAMRAELDAMQAQTDSANERINEMLKRIARNSERNSKVQCAQTSFETDSITTQINKSVTDHE